jgi:hypothetical protein
LLITFFVFFQISVKKRTKSSTPKKERISLRAFSATKRRILLWNILLCYGWVELGAEEKNLCLFEFHSTAEDDFSFLECLLNDLKCEKRKRQWSQETRILGILPFFRSGLQLLWN